MNLQESIPAKTFAASWQENGIKQLANCGSALRGDFGPESDVDVPVEFESDRIPGLFGFAGMEIELAELFGRDVHLLSRAEVEDSRNYICRKSILDSIEVVLGA